MWDYTEKVLEYFRNPKNMGEIENADAVGKVGSMACGDVMHLYLTIDKDSDTITQATFKTFGCASSIASASVLTELITGKTLEEALKVTNDDIVLELGGLPRAKMHCSVMGQDALTAAVNDYRGIETAEHDEDEGKIICRCFSITDKKIERVVKEHNLTSIEDVTNFTKAGGACQSCHLKIQDILDSIRKEPG